MRNHLYVDGTDLATFGVYISGDGTFSAPEKAYDWYDVPSKDGSVLGYERRLKNIKVSYDCFIYTNFDAQIAALRAFLLSRNGIVNINDSYHTGEFRRGVYSGPFDPSVERTLDAGKFVLTFDCLPQRWLTSGQTYTTITAPGSGSQSTTIPNTTQFAAAPVIRIFGTGRVRFGNVDITISSNYPYSDMYIDSETMRCYYGGNTDVSSYVVFYDWLENVYGVDPPKIKPGGVAVTLYASESVSKIYVTPRWWTV